MADYKTKETRPNHTLFQVLSFDVVLGALSVAIFAVTILKVDAQPVWWVILALAVWSVYTFDHLVDGFKKKGESSIYRHKFHYKYRRVLVPLVLVSGASAVVLSFLMLDRKIVIYGLELSIFVLLYFILVFFQEKLQVKYIQKELFITFVYISGIILAPVTWYSDTFLIGHYFIFFILAALAWTESVMISFFDFSQDEKDHLKSFTVVYGKKKTRQILMSLMSAVIILIMILLFVLSENLIRDAIIIELVMALLLLTLVSFPAFFSKSNRFRWIGESIFLLPALIILF
jgi:hypothetical protein